MRRLAAIERINHRLHNRNRSVISASIRPRLKKMRRWNVPLRILPGLVHVRAKVRSHLRLFKCCRKIQISRRIINRIGIQNHQPVYFARIQIRNQRLQLRSLIRRKSAQTRRIGNRLAGVAQHFIDDERVIGNRRILIQSRNHHALAWVRFQVLGQRGEKLLLLIGPCDRWNRKDLNANGLGQLRRERRNLARSQSKPMFSLQSSRCRRALNRIQPV